MYPLFPQFHWTKNLHQRLSNILCQMKLWLRRRKEYLIDNPHSFALLKLLIFGKVYCRSRNIKPLCLCLCVYVYVCDCVFCVVFTFMFVYFVLFLFFFLKKSTHFTIEVTGPDDLAIIPKLRRVPALVAVNW